jgi:hypothetical protein
LMLDDLWKKLKIFERAQRKLLIDLILKRDSLK